MKLIMDFARKCLNNLSKTIKIFYCKILSKAWGLAGLRLGYIISNKKILKY